MGVLSLSLHVVCVRVCTLAPGTSFRTSLVHLLLALGNDDEDEDDEAFSFSSYDGLTIMVP